VLTLLF